VEILFPFLVFGLLGAVVLNALTRTVDPGERAWLFQMLLAGFVLRMLSATAFAVFPALRVFHEDASGYELTGMRLAAEWSQRGPPLLFQTQELNTGFYFVTGAVYYVFGAFQVNASYFNAIVGCATACLIFRLARTLLHVRVAKMAVLMVLFTPSMILWSSIAIKDPLVSFLIVVALSSCMELKKRLSMLPLLGVVLPLAAIQPIRFYMVYFVAFAVFAAMILDRGMRALTGIYKQVFVGAIALGLMASVGILGRAQAAAEEFMSFERVSAFRHGMAIGADSGFAHDVDISTPLRALLFLPLGVANTLLGPFPWQMSSLRAALAGPETFVWWIFVPSTIRGLRFMVRHRFSETSPLLIFTVLLTCAYSLMHGNIGSAFRQRAQIFVFLFIFAAVGWYQKKCRAARIDERHLLSGELPVTEEAPVQLVPTSSALPAGHRSLQ
jgi:4-amino-4-deoxy-L-arabinose transferase-like glycosyltransferase